MVFWILDADIVWAFLPTLCFGNLSLPGGTKERWIRIFRSDGLLELGDPSQKTQRVRRWGNEKTHY